MNFSLFTDHAGILFLFHAPEINLIEVNCKFLSARKANFQAED